jgi:V8-like Glu-specific endopeptidase
MHSGFDQWIGALTSQDKFNRTVSGSAVLISNDLILTVAHNIYDIVNNCEHSNFKFQLTPYGVEEYF